MKIPVDRPHLGINKQAIQSLNQLKKNRKLKL